VSDLIAEYALPVDGDFSAAEPHRVTRSVQCLGYLD
jgi:hypothetical protein